MAMAVFYHLTRSGPDDTLMMIVQRALAQGWRVMVRGTDLAELRRLDDKLWLGAEDGFLPHGLEGGAQDADQPVLLGLGPIANGAQGLVLTGGALADPVEALALDRVWVLFDGADEAAVTDARGLWTRLTSAGLAAQYWAEDSGTWVKKTERLANGAA